ncbi:hypothetical protein [Blastococcus sp. SYSU D00813]
MTSPRTTPAERPDEAADEPKKTTLSPVQITAGALASVSSAVVASFFGVAGTLIGAALASVISTVTAALYTNSLSRTNERLRQVRVQLAGPGSPGRTAADATAELPRTTAGTAGTAAETRALPAALDPRRAPAPRRGPRWPRVAVYAVAVFGLAMVIVTGIEVVGQQPVSALVGAEEASSTTTLGELTGDSSSGDEDPGTPVPTPATTSETPATETPGDDAGTTAPTTSGTATETPSESTPEETGSSTAEPTGSSDEAPQTGESTGQDGGTSPEAAGDDAGGAAATP